MAPRQLQQRDTSPPDSRRIELGWLLAHELSAADLNIITAARQLVHGHLARRFSQFEWHMPIVWKAKPVCLQSIEPTQLLIEGSEERDIRHWDFAFVITHADLRSYYKAFAMAVPSRAVSVAVVSIARLRQQEIEAETMNEEHLHDAAARRLCALAMHLFGDLNGLANSKETNDFMYEPASAEDLESMTGFSEQGYRYLAKELSELADERLEESKAALSWGASLFYLRAAWIGRGDIVSATLQAQPWAFPFRLSRLTTAAVSALFVLLVTAEVWYLGMNQSPLFVGGMSVGALLGTSLYVLKHQNLFLQRARRRLTEQTVFTNLSTTLVILLGMATTYLLLFGLTITIGFLVYPPRLVQGWAVSLQHAVGWRDYCVMAGFVSSLGILIGALGATFEENQYFRHITFVDEET